MIFETKKMKEQRERMIRFKRVFSTEEGQEVLYHLMNTFHILQTHKGDPFAEGQRSVVLHILNQAKINIEAYDKLLSGEGMVADAE